MSNLRIAAIQTSLIWESPKQNLVHFDQVFKSLTSKVDLIILPEMFSTGFSMNSHILAVSMESEHVEWMQRKAKEYNAAITGSLIIKENGQHFNRLLFVYPDGKKEYYDKRHLFSLAGEQNHYTPGEAQKIVELKGFRIALNICYDLRFPVWSRNNDQYDMALYVANWPAKRSYSWSTLLKARAIENQTFVVGVNRIGKDENGLDYSGDSAIINFDGSTLQESQKEEVLYQSLNLDELQAFRSKFQFLNDRDAFTIEY